MDTSVSSFDIATLIVSAALGITAAYFVGICPPQSPIDAGGLAMAILGGLSLSGPVILLRRWKVNGTLTIVGGEYVWCLMAALTAFSMALLIVARPHTLLWGICAIWVSALWPAFSMMAVTGAIIFHYQHEGPKPWSHWWGITLPLLQFIAHMWLLALPS